MADPLIWVLLGRKAGDNTQVLALADELGLPYVRKSVRARSWELLPNLLLGGTLAGIDSVASSPLQAPWPDLVISAGRRNEPVARWIRQQNRSGTQLVHLGRPWAALDQWDLIVTTPQYFLPQQANIHHNRLPLQRLQPATLEAAGATLRPQLEGLSGPLVALMVGGNSGRFVFTPEKAARLGRDAAELARQRGGSLLVSNSPRTPAGSFDALLGEIDVPFFCYRFGDPAMDNPYLGFLALADEFVITGESMSMLAEASATGKPLHIFDMGDAGSWWRYGHNYTYKSLSHHLAMAVGPRRMRREIGRIQEALVAGGQATWLGEVSGPVEDAAIDESGATLERAELAETAARVRALLSG